MLNCFNFKSAKVVNPTTRQRVIDRGQDEIKIKMKHNKDIIKRWSIIKSNDEYLEGFEDKQNIMTYIKTKVIINKNLSHICMNLNNQISIIRCRFENNKKVLIDTDKKLTLSNAEAKAFLKRAERIMSNYEIK